MFMFKSNVKLNLLIYLFKQINHQMLQDLYRFDQLVLYFNMKKNQVKVQESQQLDSKGKKAPQQYKCGDQGCGKFYHSYTAFYNHCKKSHGGQFPGNSLFNDKLFQGPKKNRGRPRIKKNEAKDLVQIQSMKKENELIQFMGTLKTKKSDQLIVYVENPVERVQAAVVQVKQWLRKFHSHPLSEQDLDYLTFLEQFNRIIDENDLPEFYDPIQTHLYPDKLDSYSFSNVYNFMTRQDMRTRFNIKLQGKQLLFKIFLCWAARILSQKLFNQVTYIVLQIEKGRLQKKQLALFQKQALQLLYDKKSTLKQLISSFFQYFMKEHDRGRQGKSGQIKKQKRQTSSGVKDSARKKVSNMMSQKRFAQDQGNQQDEQQNSDDEQQQGEQNDSQDD